jgi:RimJ/RimL family protein N-acetyltransferase
MLAFHSRKSSRFMMKFSDRLQCVTPPMSPTLYTDRLILRPTSANDIEALCEQWRLPDVRSSFLSDYAPTDANARLVVNAALADRNSGLGLWSLETTGSRTLVGCAGMLKVGKRDSGTDNVEMIIQLHPTTWGCGLAAEALTALIRLAFGLLGIPSLFATVLEPNARSCTLFERLGFTLVDAKLPTLTYQLDAGDVPDFDGAGFTPWSDFSVGAPDDGCALSAFSSSR